ncbi:MAG: DUF2726 domain-containing protein [Pseudomonadota bacterium]
MSENFIIAVLAIGVLLGGCFYVWWTKFRKVAPPYAPKVLLTKGEQEFFLRLCKALPAFYIFPKVAMLGLLEPRESKRLPGGAEFNKIAQEKIDYAIYDATLRLICIVELVDPMRSAEAEPLGSRYLTTAGIKQIRWDATNKPSVEQISRVILPLEHQTISRPSLVKQNLAKSDPFHDTSMDTVIRMRQSDPEPSHIKGLSPFALDQLTPRKVLQKNYPHIWKRISEFASEPKHLQKYLISLSIQDRAGKRAGFSLEALQEIANIQLQNDEFISRSVAGWQPAFVNR